MKTKQVVTFAAVLCIAAAALPETPAQQSGTRRTELQQLSITTPMWSIVAWKNHLDSPACLVAEEGDMSGHLARLLKQAGQTAPESRPILEVNTEHALVKRLDGSERFDDLAHILFDQALLADRLGYHSAWIGEQLAEAAVALARRVHGRDADEVPGQRHELGRLGGPRKLVAGRQLLRSAFHGHGGIGWRRHGGERPRAAVKGEMHRFLLERSGVRGVLLNLGPSWQEIARRGQYPEPLHRARSSSRGADRSGPSLGSW
mgnify:CR=1 FL=1